VRGTREVRVNLIPRLSLPIHRNWRGTPVRLDYGNCQSELRDGKL